MRSMQWQFGIWETISAFAYRHRETKKNLCRDGRSQDLPNTDFQPAVRHLKQKQQYTHNTTNTHKMTTLHTTTTIHTRQLTTIHTIHLKIQHVQEVNRTKDITKINHTVRTFIQISKDHQDGMTSDYFSRSITQF